MTRVHIGSSLPLNLRFFFISIIIIIIIVIITITIIIVGQQTENGSSKQNQWSPSKSACILRLSRYE